jgi:hypothetical protein
MTAVADDAPLRLEVAARLAFPDGSMKISGLRKERDAGRLSVSRIAGRDYTTLADIRRMIQLCRREEKAKVQGSTTAKTRARGTSETAPSSDPRAAYEKIVRELKADSQNTSRSGQGQTSGAVVPMKSRSSQS